LPPPRTEIGQLAGFGLENLAGIKQLAFPRTLEDSYAYTALCGAAASAVTQGISVATGLQKSFSWREVDLAGMSAPVARFAGEQPVGLTGASGRAGGLRHVSK
jgi:hypothetical protein